MSPLCTSGCRRYLTNANVFATLQDTMTLTATPNESTVSEDVPTREAVIGRITAALSEGRELSSVTAEQALGVSAERLRAATATNEVRPPRLGNDYSRHRTGVLRQKIASDSPVTIVGLGGRELVRDRLKPFIQELGIEALLEICDTPGHEDMLRRITAGITTVHFANRFSNTNVDFEDTSFAISRQRVVDLISESPNWEVFNCPWDDRFPAFAVKTGPGPGQHSTVLIFLNLFGTAEGQWVRSARGLDTRIAAFKEIMRAALPLLTNSFRYSRPDPAAEQIKEMNELFLTMRAFGQQALGRINTELEEARATFERKQREIRSFQEQLVAATQEQREAGEKVTLLSAGSGERIAQALESAMTSMEHIKGRRAVKNVTFTTRNGGSALYVELYDCVVKTGGDDTRDNILCKNLNFWLMLDPNVTYPFVWDNAKKPSGQPSLHPNIYTGGDTCWGNIGTTIAEQWRERNWLSVVTLVTQLLLNVGYPEASNVGGFPIAPPDLPTGFQYPRES